MREILFRGKRKTNNEWVYGNYCGAEYLINEGIEHFIIEIPRNGSSSKVIPETVGQYTGLTDKNGKKIFEGDILETPAWYTNNAYPCVCIFAEEHRVESIQGFGLYHKINDSFELVQSDEWDEFKVIGNIHDNPELLKGE